MTWEKKPLLLLLLATLSILVGTLITMVLPFAWVNTEGDRIEAVKPYKPLELAGRDVYIREGCNNCHSQTVRPLEHDVKRYGPFSRSGEFAYDRPFLWGSRRMGPDLARVGGRYPDSWHVKHMKNPSSMVPDTNMPAYAFIEGEKVDPELTRKKMRILGFPFAEAEITGLVGKTELDALVAYLQKLGSDLPRSLAPPAGAAAAAANPYAGNKEAAREGSELYAKHCASCHGKDRQGDLATELKAGAIPDSKVFGIISRGEPKEGMPSFGGLGEERLWKIVTFLNAKAN